MRRKKSKAIGDNVFDGIPLSMLVNNVFLSKWINSCSSVFPSLRPPPCDSVGRFSFYRRCVPPIMCSRNVCVLFSHSGSLLALHSAAPATAQWKLCAQLARRVFGYRKSHTLNRVQLLLNLVCSKWCFYVNYVIRFFKCLSSCFLFRFARSSKKKCVCVGAVVPRAMRLESHFSWILLRLRDLLGRPLLSSLSLSLFTSEWCQQHMRWAVAVARIYFMRSSSFTRS